MHETPDADAHMCVRVCVMFVCVCAVCGTPISHINAHIAVHNYVHMRSTWSNLLGIFITSAA